MKNKNTKKIFCLKKIKKFDINISKQLLRFIIFLICFVSISFIVCVNDIAIKGFVIKDLKTKLADLEEENKQNELEIHELKSLENISLRVQKLKMVKVDKIDYITVIDGSVALND